jgi:hypothetical protein
VPPDDPVHNVKDRRRFWLKGFVAILRLPQILDGVVACPAVPLQQQPHPTDQEIRREEAVVHVEQQTFVGGAASDPQGGHGRHGIGHHNDSYEPADGAGGRQTGREAVEDGRAHPVSQRREASQGSYG